MWQCVTTTNNSSQEHQVKASHTTRKKSINDAFKVSRKSNNDASLKRHGIDCHCKYLDTLTLVTSIIILNKNIDNRKKRHNLFNLIYLL